MTWQLWLVGAVTAALFLGRALSNGIAAVRNAPVGGPGEAPAMTRRQLVATALAEHDYHYDYDAHLWQCKCDLQDQALRLVTVHDVYAHLSDVTLATLDLAEVTS